MGILKTFFSRMGLAESDTDTARKSAAADQIVARSLAVTDPALWTQGTTPYKDRLHAALMRVPTRALDFMNKHDISLCLDRRFCNIKTGMLEPDISVLLYNGPVKVLSINDHGKTPSENGFTNKLILNFGIDSIRALPQTTQEHLNKQLLTRMPVAAGQVVVPVWMGTAGIESVLKKNPALYNAPTRGAAPCCVPAPT